MRPFPIVGHVPHIVWKGLLNVAADVSGNKGRVGRLVMGPKTVHVISHPDHIRHIFVDNASNYIKGSSLNNLRLLLGQGLVTSDGELWKRERNIVQVAFQRDKISELIRLAGRSIEQMLARWDSEPSRKLEDVSNEIRRLVFIMSGLTLFGCDLTDNVEQATRAFAAALSVITSRNENVYALPLSVPTPGNLRLRRAIQVLDRQVENIVDMRRGRTETNDVLSVLLRAQSSSSEEGVNPRRLRDEVITLYLAGHDATSHTLTWVLHFLAQDPSLQQQVREEAKRLLGGTTPGYGELRPLALTQRVIQEAMRIRPAAALLARELVADDEIDGKRLKAGSWILVSSYLTHRLAEFWPDPERFDPERFSEEASRSRHPFAYYPFGLGPRTCIGNHLASLEVQMITAMVLQRYEFAHPPGAKVKPVWHATLHPEGGLPLIRSRL